ncbi:hypothetical protein B0T18DRAFT_33366 [Schizothecium vesticola]|uniref:Uncharacterized protein n=1 Tax=Schizothecium vesticola TaxID=314040 RepID=A0AA40FBG9_9PEZI|nr:hypothetical protein B0T18DRAFT_33366 [Schizothecium vesticola]
MTVDKRHSRPRAMAISRAPARQTRLKLPMPSRLQQTSKRCQISTWPSAHRSDTFLLLHISIFPSLECGCPSAVITFPSAYPYIESASRYLHCLAQDGRSSMLSRDEVHAPELRGHDNKLGVSALGSHLCNPRVSVVYQGNRSSRYRPEHSSRLTPDLAKPTHTASIKRRLPRNQSQKTTTTTPTDGQGLGLRGPKETRQRRIRWSAQSLQCVDRENIPGMNLPPLAARWPSRDSRPMIECLCTLPIHATSHHMCLPTWE